MAAAAAGPYDSYVADPEMQEFWEHARHERLAVQRCSRCGDVHFPPAPVCPQCLGDDQAWSVVSGRARLESLVEFHRAYWPHMADRLPYRVALVRLDEGPLLVTNLVGEQEAEIGAALHVVFDRVDEAVTLPKFAVDDLP